MFVTALIREPCHSEPEKQQGVVQTNDSGKADIMKVLIAVDSSPSSDRVLEEAAARPWPAGTSFSVVNVVDVQRFARLPALIEDAQREGDQIVRAGVDKLSRSGHSALPEVILGFPRGAISEYAKEWHADLIMAGSHGHSAIGRFLLGSVAQGILRTAPCSVEIVRFASGAPAPSSHSMKILLATDGSDCSAAAAHSVATRLWPAGTLFNVVSVEELVTINALIQASSLASVFPASLLEELIDEAHSRAMNAIEGATKILVQAGRKVFDQQPVPVGDPRTVILDCAETWPADLIVLGSHGRRGLDRFLMGSVAESVAIHAHCSVEVIGVMPASRKRSRPETTTSCSA
jgi:nucleotide-binding universal stress UspA family protein